MHASSSAPCDLIAPAECDDAAEGLENLRCNVISSSQKNLTVRRDCMEEQFVKESRQMTRGGCAVVQS